MPYPDLAWREYNHSVYKDEDAPHVRTGEERVHLLNLTKGNRRVFCNLRITEIEKDFVTGKQRRLILLKGESCTIFTGTLEEAKKESLIYLPRIIDEARKLITTYEELISRAET